MINNVASPVSKSLVDELVTPIIKKLKTNFKKKYNELLVPKGEHFKKYLDEAYNEYSFINSLVFHDRIKSLKEIYLPLTLIKDGSEEELLNDNDSVVIDGIPLELINSCRKLLIIDTAGMGKSTMLKRMFIDVVEKGLDKVGIPIFIDLRRLKKDWSIIDEIEQRISNLSENFDKELLLHFLEIGEFIFFLDGYDEIPLIDKHVVTRNLQDFVKKAKDNLFVLTSRPESALMGFAGFEIYKIRPLKKDEAFDLLRKYDVYDDKRVSTQLINMLESNDYKSALEFLRNPLLTSLLFNAFDYKQTIPLKKHLFYRQVYDAYFENHDLKKGDGYVHDKLCGLDIDDFSRMLRYIGFHSLKHGIEYGKDEIIGIIDKAKKSCGDLPKFSSNDFLKDALSAVPLFCNVGFDKYKWVHKSLMEYFAAMFISDDAKENQDIILSAIYDSNQVSRYVNMLDIYYDIDNKGFSKNITLRFCMDFLQFRRENYKDSKSISQGLIEDRIGLLYAGIKAIQARTIGAGSKTDFEELGDVIYAKRSYSVRRTLGLFLGGDMNKMSMYELVLKKRVCLFSQIKNKNMSISRIMDALNTERVVQLDVDFGDNDKVVYEMINTTMMPRFIHGFMLDYKACEKEIKRINKDIKLSENSTYLLEGI